MDRPHRRGQDYNNVDLFKPNVYLKEVYPYPEPGAAPEGQQSDALKDILGLINTKWLDTFTSGKYGCRYTVGLQS